MLQRLTNFAQDYDYSTLYDTNTTTTTADAGVSLVVILLGLALLVFVLAAMWKVFAKAGKPGWAALVPIYNIIVLLQIVGRPVWWIVFFLLGVIPFVGAIVSLVISIVISNDLAKSFGKDVGYTVLLVLVPFVGYPMLAWGDAKYHGPAALKGGSGKPKATPAV